MTIGDWRRARDEIATRTIERWHEEGTYQWRLWDALKKDDEQMNVIGDCSGEHE